MTNEQWAFPLVIAGAVASIWYVFRRPAATVVQAPAAQQPSNLVFQVPGSVAPLDMSGYQNETPPALELIIPNTLPYQLQPFWTDPSSLSNLLGSVFTAHPMPVEQPFIL
jgi:hypothetical protein